jgi:hypothetical protein
MDTPFPCISAGISVDTTIPRWRFHSTGSVIPFVQSDPRVPLRRSGRSPCDDDIGWHPFIQSRFVAGALYHASYMRARRSHASVADIAMHRMVYVHGETGLDGAIGFHPLSFFPSLARISVRLVYQSSEFYDHQPCRRDVRRTRRTINTNSLASSPTLRAC